MVFQQCRLAVKSIDEKWWIHHVGAWRIGRTAQLHDELRFSAAEMQRARVCCRKARPGRIVLQTSRADLLASVGGRALAWPGSAVEHPPGCQGPRPAGIGRPGGSYPRPAIGEEPTAVLKLLDPDPAPAFERPRRLVVSVPAMDPVLIRIRTELGLTSTRLRSLQLAHTEMLLVAVGMGGVKVTVRPLARAGMEPRATGAGWPDEYAVMLASCCADTAAEAVLRFLNCCANRLGSAHMLGRGGR